MTNVCRICIYTSIYIDLMSWVLANGPEDRGSILDELIPKIEEKVLYAALLNTPHYKVWVKGKVEQSREKRSLLPYTLV